MKRADLLSALVEIKRLYQRGVKAQRGVNFWLY